MKTQFEKLNLSSNQATLEKMNRKSQQAEQQSSKEIKSVLLNQNWNSIREKETRSMVYQEKENGYKADTTILEGKSIHYVELFFVKESIKVEETISLKESFLETETCKFLMLKKGMKCLQLTGVAGTQCTSQLFDKMISWIRRQRKHKKFPKSWKFKFKTRKTRHRNNKTVMHQGQSLRESSGLPAQRDLSLLKNLHGSKAMTTKQRHKSSGKSWNHIGQELETVIAITTYPKYIHASRSQESCCLFSESYFSVWHRWKDKKFQHINLQTGSQGNSIKCYYQLEDKLDLKGRGIDKYKNIYVPSL